MQISLSVSQIFIYVLDLRVQIVSIPLHVPFARHFLEYEPVRIYPASQENLTSFGNSVSSPNKVPFRGIGNGPQSTAAKKCKTTQNKKIALL